MGAADDHEYEESKTSGMTLLVVIFSLVFVAVFGGALVGGIVSGDPDGTFFTVIIVTSTLAITVAVIFGIRKVYCKKRKHRDMDQKVDLRGTFTRSEEENHHYDEDPEYNGHYEKRYEARPTPVNARINEIKAGSVAGDMSALSPTTLEMETDQRTTPGKRSGRTPRRESSGRRPFDFANVSVGSERRNGPRREDPPESSDASYAESFTQRLMDPPTGPIDADHYLEEEERNDNEDEEEEVADPISSSSHHRRRLSSSSHHTSTSRYLVDEDNYDEFGGEEVKPKSPAKKESSKRQTPKHDVSISRLRYVIMPSPSSHLSFLDSQVPPPPPPPPPSTEPPSSTSLSMSSHSKVPATPMSEAGSVVSSIFLKPFSAVFGKRKAASEASFSDASAYQKGSEAGSGYNTNGPKLSGEKSKKSSGSEVGVSSKTPMGAGEKSKKSNGSEVGVSSKTPMGANRPPKPGRNSSVSQSDVGESKNLETINAGNPASTKRGRSGYETEIGRYAPATPTGSTFSRGAASSTAPSEFRSTAGSSVFSAGVASSTFDPQVHQAALTRLQRNSAIIGAQRVNDDPEVFFEEDDEESDFGTGTAYDVFAPPGPIGIVVDTTQAGPIVHSLKKSSPMQGLISPGDLILALDGKDVRRMNAATLTKLMAKRSRQSERKFTLMPLEDYVP
jgi:hypothetical protein